MMCFQSAQSMRGQHGMRLCDSYRAWITTIFVTAISHLIRSPASSADPHNHAAHAASRHHGGSGPIILAWWDSERRGGMDVWEDIVPCNLVLNPFATLQGSPTTIKNKLCIQLAEPVDGAFGSTNIDTVRGALDIAECGTDDCAVECAECGTDERGCIQLAEPVHGAECGTVFVAELCAERGTDDCAIGCAECGNHSRFWLVARMQRVSVLSAHLQCGGYNTALALPQHPTRQVSCTRMLAGRGETLAYMGLV